MKLSQNVYVVGGLRLPFAKSFTAYQEIPMQELMSTVLRGLVDKYRLQGQRLGDVALGAVMKSSQDWNLARECVLDSGLSATTPAYDVQRACGTSLETTWQLALKIASGAIDSAIAGGVDSNSDLPTMLRRKTTYKLLRVRNSKTFAERVSHILNLRPSDFFPDLPAVVEKRTLLSMGEHCERMVKEWQIPRGDQDQLALASHKNGAAAYATGFYEDLVLPYKGLKQDNTLRGDTSLEKLGKLRPAFDKSEHGTLTAGNSSPLTDGAAAVLLGSHEFCKKHNLPRLARFVDAEAAAVDFVGGEGLLMAPTAAVSRLLTRQGLQLQDFDYYEIHEAFAGQVLCTLKAWESEKYCREKLGRDRAMGTVDRSKLNVNGSSVALGHPFAATGARIVSTLAKALAASREPKRGLISICTAGGMGVAAILESCPD